MQDKGPERFIFVKAYEIAYAVFRVAGSMEEKVLSEKLRASGADLLESATAQDWNGSACALQVLECLIKFAGDINAIGPSNCETIAREIYALNAAIAERKNVGNVSDMDLSEIFSKELESPAPHRTEQHKPDSYMATANEVATGVSGMIKSGIRQTAILEKIRQSGNCRIRDLQELLPESSERTLRYDLQSLMEQNLIERIGNGGPAVYYRIPQTQTQ